MAGERLFVTRGLQIGTPHRPSPPFLPRLRRIPRRHSLALGPLHRTRLRPPVAFPSGLSPRPYTIRFLNDPGPIKAILRPEHCTSSRNASYGSASLQRHETGSLARGVLPHSPPPLLVLAPVGAVDYSLQQLRLRVQFWVLLVSSSVNFLGFGSFLFFHLVLFLAREIIPGMRVVLAFYSNVPAIGLACLVFVHRPQTCRVSRFLFFRQLGLRRFLSDNRPRTCRFPTSAVRRLSLPRFDNRPQHRHGVVP